MAERHVSTSASAQLDEVASGTDIGVLKVCFRATKPAPQISASGRQGEFAGGWTGHSTVTARRHQYLPLDRLRMAGSRVLLTVALSASQSQVSDLAALRPPNATVCSQSQADTVDLRANIRRWPDTNVRWTAAIDGGPESTRRHPRGSRMRLGADFPGFLKGVMARLQCPLRAST